MEVETMAANAEMEETLDQSTEAPLEAEMEEAEAPQENQEEGRRKPGRRPVTPPGKRKTTHREKPRSRTMARM